MGLQPVERRRLVMAAIGVALFGVLVPAQTGWAATTRRMDDAGSFGFVKEIDEPAVRGQLTRVSPDDLNVFGRFALSPSESVLVVSARPVKAKSGEAYQLYKISTTGQAAPVRITGGSEDGAFFPSFTADGRHIVYWSSGTFWRINSDGIGARTKLPGSGVGVDCCGQMSMDRRLVFTSLQSRYSGGSSSSITGPPRLGEITSLIWAVKGDGSELTQYREGSLPTWSPDGSKLVFDYAEDIWMMDADGSNLVQLTQSPDFKEGVPSFTPDGSTILYVSNEGTSSKFVDNFNIWSMGRDGRNVQQLTSLRSWDSWPVGARDGVYFLSARGAGQYRAVRIWKITNQ